MIANMDLKKLFLFPIKDDEARKNFLITTLVYFAGFVVPILPMLVVMGYAARVMRQVVNGEEPHMTAWDGWETMLKDGVYLFGVSLVYTLPLFIIIFPLYIGMVFAPIWMEANGANDEFLFLPLLFFAIAMALVFPLSLALGILLPAAQTHAIINDDFAAGFRVREWWTIFRSNWAGFILAYVISMVASWILMSIVMIAMMTIVLFCIVPFIMPAISAYSFLVMYAAFSYAYKDGKANLSDKQNATA